MRESCILFMAKLLEAQIHEETKLWSLIVLCLSRSKYARKEQWRRGKQSKENRGQQIQSSFALLEHFLKSIFYMLYTISKLRKSRIQIFKPCTIWSWNEEDMAFRRQLHQAEGQFRTLRNWNSNVRNLKWMAAVKSRWSPAFEVDFATCELRYQRAKVDSKLRNQLAKFSQVTMQRAKLGYLCRRLFFFWYFCV